MNISKDNIIHIADTFAIPMFALLTHYFYSIKNRTITENILFTFAIVGLIADLFFTFQYVDKIF